MLVGNDAYTPPSFESIATANATGSTDYIDFTSIPSTYKHLQIRGMAKDSASYKLLIRFNSDSGSNYARHELRGYGTGVTADATASTTRAQVLDTLSNTANIFSVFIIDILDYGSTSKYKTIRVLSGYDVNGTGQIAINSGLWMSTSAINSIRIFDEVGGTNLSSGSTFALYGIKEA